MATWDNARRAALALPETAEDVKRGRPSWSVKRKAFAWDRPLRRTDLQVLGDAAPSGEILCVRVEHLVAKEALLADPSGVFFTTPHFDGYAMVLVELDRVSVAELEEVLAEAWLASAPERLSRAYLEARG